MPTTWPSGPRRRQTRCCARSNECPTCGVSQMVQSAAGRRWNGGSPVTKADMSSLSTIVRLSAECDLVSPTPPSGGPKGPEGIGSTLLSALLVDGRKKFEFVGLAAPHPALGSVDMDGRATN